MSNITNIINLLQEPPIPQYVIGRLPVIFTIGTTPIDGFYIKIYRILVCIGCPIVGLYYFCNISKNPIAEVVYWLSFDKYENINNILNNENTQLIDMENHSENEEITNNEILMEEPIYIFYNFKVIQVLIKNNIYRNLKKNIIEASILERLSLLFPIYYIIIGIISGLVRAFGPCSTTDWPYTPLLLIWTIPVIWNRGYKGKIVAIDPNSNISDNSIKIEDVNEHTGNNINIHLVFITIFTTITHWLVICLAYFTPPVGFGCRSQYLTIICAIWSFNNIIMYFYQRYGKKIKIMNIDVIYLFFFISGIFVIFWIIILVTVSYNQMLWIKYGGEKCNISNTCS